MPDSDAREVAEAMGPGALAGRRIVVTGAQGIGAASGYGVSRRSRLAIHNQAGHRRQRWPGSSALSPR